MITEQLLPDLKGGNAFLKIAKLAVEKGAQDCLVVIDYELASRISWGARTYYRKTFGSCRTMTTERVSYGHYAGVSTYMLPENRGMLHVICRDSLNFAFFEK